MTRTRLGAVVTVATVVFVASGSRGHPVSVHHHLSGQAIARSEALKRVLEDYELANERAEKTLHVPFEEDFKDPYRKDRAWWFSQPLLQENCGNRYYGTTAKELIVFGSVMEDYTFNLLNHFYEPTSKTDGNPLGSYAENAKQRAFDPVAFNLWSYDRALEYYYTALTDLGPLAREQAWAKTFYALGHVIHLVQDMSEPSHVRGDPHVGNGTGTGPAMLEAWGGHHACRENDTVARILKTRTTAIPSFPHASEYLTELALQTAANFFSDDTVGEEQSDILDPILADPILGGELPLLYDPPCGRAGACQYPPLWWVVENPCAGGDEPDADWWGIVNGSVPWQAVEMRMAAMGWFTSLFFDPEDFTVEEARWLATVDDPCVLRDNAALLYPAAVAYSTGLLDHFFRGKLTLTGTAEPEGGQQRLHLTLKNDGADAIEDLSELVWKWERTDENYNDLEVTLEFTGTLDPGAAVIGEALYPVSDAHAPKDAVTVVVAYDGVVGDERGVVGGRSRVKLLGASHGLTVHNGSGSGTYPECTNVPIVPDPPMGRQLFSQWQGYNNDTSRAAAVCCSLKYSVSAQTRDDEPAGFCDIFDCTNGVLGGTIDPCCAPVGGTPLFVDCYTGGYPVDPHSSPTIWEDTVISAEYVPCIAVTLMAVYVKLKDGQVRTDLHVKHKDNGSQDVRVFRWSARRPQDCPRIEACYCPCPCAERPCDVCDGDHPRLVCPCPGDVECDNPEGVFHYYCPCGQSCQNHWEFEARITVGRDEEGVVEGVSPERVYAAFAIPAGGHFAYWNDKWVAVDSPEYDCNILLDASPEPNVSLVEQVCGASIVP